MLRRALAAVLLGLAPAATAVAGGDDASCLRCHADRAELTKALGGKTRAIEPLLVSGEAMKASVHGRKPCLECHDAYEAFPHPPREKVEDPVTCATCHEKDADVFAGSVHGRAKEGAPRLPVRCADCHGVHDIVKTGDPASPVSPLRIYHVCGKCHFERDPDRSTPDEILKERFADDVHGFGILKAGLVVSATCVSCHGSHDIRPKGDPDAPVSRRRIDQTCGKCHVGVLAEYRTSVHHAVSDGADHRGATCRDCHLPHDIRHPDADFRAKSVDACANCHEQRSGSFRQSYHGKVSSLGFGGTVASCADCHGSHAILPVSDPRSQISAQNRVATCGRCHEGSHAEFTRYLVHADVGDRERYPVLWWVWRGMNALLVVALAMGGVHALLWLVRATAAGEWRRPRPAEDARYVRRWPKAYVSYHATLMTTVLLLASTGLPLHYASRPWARRLMAFFGGPTAAGWVHRVAALTLIGLAAAFVAHIAWRALARREKGLFAGAATMLPRRKDLEDLLGNLRWFLFLGERPRYDRWTYWEKFDFWAVFWGLLVIGLSGLMLWFPETATRLVPGWMLNVAVIVHGIEALLDIAFIFTVHVFHANLRPDKFPMDTMFLTGRVTEAEFRRERPEEYDRAVRDGTLAALAAEPPPRKTRLLAYAIGACALAVGWAFIAAMVVALLSR